ncbi:MAG: DUF192 domain-containing protein [Nanoarchaeota archaeon]
MAKLIHKKKIILNDMKYAKNIFSISRGLMFASKKKIEKGMCLVLPLRRDKKFSSSVTMLFVFYPLEILFVNGNYKVVDKIILKPFKFSYIPKQHCKYIIESKPNTFNNIKIGDKIDIKN